MCLAHLFPVGIDQRQHLELARDIAIRFNNIYSPTFTVPEAYIPETGMKIMSLAEPTKKMSKSDSNANASVGLLDSRDQIIAKFKRAVTDSGSEVRYGEGKDGINNLINIYCCFTGKTRSETEREFEGKGYGEFKMAVGETVADGLSSLREEYGKLICDKQYLDQIMASGAEKASAIARKTISKVHRKIGYVSV